MAEANTQQTQVNPVEAREFLSGLGHQPDALKGMPDPDVVKLYTAANETVTKHAAKVIPFGEKWREHIAGEDQEAMKTLGRFQDPKALFGSYNELRTKMAKGELKQVTPFPKDGPPEVQAAWRKDNGIPESPDKYDIKLTNNVVIGEDDKPMVDGFLKYAHSQNWNNDTAKQGLEWYFGSYIPEINKAQAEADAEYRAKTEATLAGDWGADYGKNMTAVKNFLSRAPKEIQNFIQGRLPDGTAIGNHPAMLKWMADMELTLNPHTTLTGPAGADAMKNVEGRIKEIEETMRTNRAKYDKDEAMQKELRDLYDAQARMAKK